MREGLLLANEHYGEIDLETYRLNIMNSLDIAEDKVQNLSAPTKPASQTSLDTDTNSDEPEETENDSGEEADLKKVLLDLISRLDQGEGVDFDTLLSNAAARGHDRDASESSLDELTEEGSVHEPRFGWFKITN